MPIWMKIGYYFCNGRRNNISNWKPKSKITGCQFEFERPEFNVRLENSSYNIRDYIQYTFYMERLVGRIMLHMNSNSTISHRLHNQENNNVIIIIGKFSITQNVEFTTANNGKLKCVLTLFAKAKIFPMSITVTLLHITHVIYVL